MKTLLLTTALVLLLPAVGHAHPKPKGAGKSAPVVAAKKNGSKYDARTGNPVAEGEDDADEVEVNRPSTRVVLHEDTDQYEQSMKKFGDDDLKVEFGKVTANKTVSYGPNWSEIEFENRISIAEAHGEHDYKKTWKHGSFGIKVQADAMLGAEATGSSGTALGRRGISGGGDAGALAGASVTCEITPYAVICDLKFSYTASPEALAGFGGDAEATFTFDWTDLRFRKGMSKSLTQGGGLGLGHSVEVDLKALKDDWKGTTDCLEDVTNELLAKATHVVRDVLYENTKRKVVEWFGTMDEARARAMPLGTVGGWNQSRNAKTRPGAAGAGQDRTGPSRSAGVDRSGRTLAK